MHHLGANSLLDIVVFGRGAALRIGEVSKPGDKLPPLPKDAGMETLARVDKIRNAKVETIHVPYPYSYTYI